MGLNINQHFKKNGMKNIDLTRYTIPVNPAQIEAVKIFWNILNTKIGTPMPKTAKFLIV